MVGTFVLIAFLSGWTCGEVIKCEIQSSLIAQAAEPGQSVTLKCSLAAGKHIKEFKWVKDSEDILNTTALQVLHGSWMISSTIILKNVTAKDAGRYICQAWNDRVLDKDDWMLKVYDPPQINKTQRRVEWISGTTKFLDCDVSGYPVPRIKWLFNNKTLEPMQNTWEGGYSLQNDFKPNRLTLRIYIVNSANTGLYTCKAENSRGKDEHTISLNVRGLPIPIVNTETSYLVAHAGENVTLVCTANDIYRQSTIVSWYFNESLVSSHAKATKEFLPNNQIKFSLTIPRLTGKDAGIYRCSVKVLSQEGEEVIHLILENKDLGLPVVTTDDHSIEVTAGSSRSLYCIVTYPRYSEASFSWTRNGSRILQTKHLSNYKLISPSPVKVHGNIMLVKFGLMIKNFTWKEAGVFSCAANTTVGFNYTSINVTLHNNDTVKSKRSLSNDKTNALVVIVTVITCTAGSAFGFIVAIAIRHLIKKKGSHQQQYGDFNNHEFKYDVFITFSSKDFDWVKTNLIRLLDKHVLKYCIHTRDFEIGKAIMDNIAESVYKSRIVISIMSENYMSSKYCREELDLALYRSTEMDDASLIVIRVDNIQKSKLPKALRNKTFLDYTDLDERKHWERRLLKYLLTHNCKTNLNETTF